MPRPDVQAGINKVAELLEEQYGIGVDDALNADTLASMISDGEDPQAIVDHVAEKYGLERIDIPITLGGSWIDHSLN